MRDIYKNDDITLTLETLCRELDTHAHFERMTDGLPFWSKETEQ
jgi:hypothetical protein